MHTKEFHRILSEFPPEEQAVISWWQVWCYPHILSAEEIAEHLPGFTPERVTEVIHKFNRNCRARLEISGFLLLIRTIIESDCDD